MANSYVEYSSGLTATTYNIPFNFISVDDVLVKGYNGSSWSDLTVASRDSTAKTVTLDTAPSALQKIRVYRSTSTAQLVDFQNGSRLSERDLDTAYQQGLFVAQEVSENASTEVEGIGPQGPQGIQGVAGNDGADGAAGAAGAAGADSALPNSFESSEITVPQSPQQPPLTAAHGLGTTPKLAQALLKCTSAEFGYSVGDYAVPATGSLFFDGTTVGFTTSFYQVTDRTGTYSTQVITDTSWKLVLRAFA